MGVSEKAANEHGDFVLADVHHDQAIVRMAQLRQIETSVAREKCDVSLPAQKHDDFVILHPLAADVNSNFPWG